MKTKLLAIALTVSLAAFTLFIAMDTFVIPRGYQVNVNASDMFAQIKAATEESDVQNKAENTASPGQEEQEETDILLKEEEADFADSALINETADNPAAEKEKSDNKEIAKTGSNTIGTSSGRNASVVIDRPVKVGKSHREDSDFGASPGSSRNSSRGSETLSITSQTDNTYSYQDDHINISISQYTVNDSTVYAADIRLTSAEYLKTAFANSSYGRNFTEKTSSIASANNAVLAVNGDYYGARERGYVIRNGVVYRDSISDSDVLCIYVDGTMEIIDPSKTTTQELVNKGAWQAFSFGPALVKDGEISISTDEEVGMSMFSNPRTAIGIIDPLHYVFVVSDGRTDTSEGLSLYLLAGFMQKLGAKTAYNLDGGGSSTMVFQGSVINRPTTTGNSIKEREVSDIVYIG